MACDEAECAALAGRIRDTVLHRSQDAQRYRELTASISRETRAPASRNLVLYYTALANCMGCLNGTTDDIVAAALNLTISEASLEVLDAYLHFAATLAVGSVFAGACIKRLVEQLRKLDELAQRTAADDEAAYTQRQETRIAKQNAIITALCAIVARSPSQWATISEALVKLRPYFNEAFAVQEAFFTALFNLTIRLPPLIPTALNLALSHMAKLDSSIADDVSVAKPNGEPAEDEEEEGMFAMDEERAAQPESSGGYDEQADDTDSQSYPSDPEHPLVKLDHIMALTIELLNYLEQQLPTCTYEPLWEAFVASVLPLHRSRRVQFIAFYGWNLHAEYPSRVALGLWERAWITDDSLQNRQASLGYLSSFLARAQNADLNLVAAVIEMIFTAAVTYQEQLTLQELSDASRHSIFYAACQAMFYLISFRARHFKQTAGGAIFLRKLGWEKLLASKLCPLHHVDGSVRDFFAQAMRDLEVVAVEPYMSRKSDHDVLRFRKGRVDIALHRLEAFFPFDPSQPPLREAGKIIGEFYNSWTEADPEPSALMSGVSVSSDDFLPSHSRPSDRSGATPRSFSLRARALNVVSSSPRVAAAVGSTPLLPQSISPL